MIYLFLLSLKHFFASVELGGKWRSISGGGLGGELLRRFSWPGPAHRILYSTHRGADPILDPNLLAESENISSNPDPEYRVINTGTYRVQSKKSVKIKN